MEPGQIAIITMIGGVSLGLLTKLLIILRKNVKNCCGIVFKTPDTSSHNSPRHVSDNNISHLPMVELHKQPHPITLMNTTTISPEQIKNYVLEHPDTIII